MTAFEEARTRLDRLIEAVESGAFKAPTHAREWSGADVVITSSPPPPPAANAFYPAPRYVVTPYSLNLSHLFVRLGNIFSPPLLDSASNIEFYGRLANVGRDWHERSAAGSPDERGLLKWVLWEARVILDELEHGEFDHLLVAPGGMIFSDALRAAERDGYLGADETSAFLAYMDAKHADA
jgi:hypothetical protein